MSTLPIVAWRVESLDVNGRRMVFPVLADAECFCFGDETPEELTPRADALSALTQARAERDGLRAALEYLIEKCDASDDACYGTLATNFVRDVARAALSKATQEKQG
jgi:hypothetical protein